jgi:HemX protein
MEVWTGLTTVLLPLAYLMLWGSYVWFFVAERNLARRWSRTLTGGTLFIHVVHVLLRTIELGRLPLATPLEFFSLLALTILVIYVIIERVLRVRVTGVLVVGLSFLLQFIASAFSAPAPAVDPLLSDPGYGIHALLVLLSYTSLSLSFLFAVLYLVQARQLSRRNFGLLFRRLPPLETLERMSVGTVRLGIPLLFLALASGHLWLYNLRDTLPADIAAMLTPFDPKILASWIILLGYTAGLIGHDRLGWRGRRMNIVAIAAWVTVVATMGLMHHFVPSFHDFSLRSGM